MNIKENSPSRLQETTEIDEYVDCATGKFRRGARVRIQNELNEILLELCVSSGFSPSDSNIILAALSKMWDTPPGVGYQRARIEIAKCITSKGDDEAKRRTVSRFYARLDKRQAKCGYMLLEREPGTRTANGLGFEDHAATLIPHIAPLLELANDKRKADPRWKTKKLRGLVTREIVEWIKPQLPKAPAYSENKPEDRERIPLSSYTQQGIDSVAGQVERRADVVLNDYHSALEADRFYVDLIRRLERDRTSRKKIYEAQLLGLTRDPDAWFGPGGGDKSDSILSHSKETVISDTPLSPVTQEADKPEYENVREMCESRTLVSYKFSQVLSSQQTHFQTKTNVCSDMDDYQGRLEANFPEPLESARWALEGFDSVDAGPPLEVFYLRDDVPKPRPIERQPIPSDLRSAFEKWIPGAKEMGWSLVLRMTGSGPGRERPLIQVDDCNDSDIERLRPYCFMQYQTSPGSYHTWLAIEGPPDQFEIIRARLLTQLGRTSKANGGGYGSMRWPGSMNFKPEYREPDGTFPVIEPVYRSLGHWVTEAELEQAGLLAPRDPEPEPGDFPAELPETPPGDWWPDMQRELDRYKNGESRQRSRAAARWVAIALRAGHSREAVKKRLYQESEKAKERGLDWTAETVDEVADYMGVL